VSIPPSLRTLLRASLAIALVHIMFGGFVRISGSGMGCGEHWPMCQGAWFPPLDRPTLVIEWTHRLLALVLIVTVAATALAAYRARGIPGVGGAGGVLRPSVTALVIVVTTALFGAVTVWLQNAPLATVVHWVLAASLLATLANALVRAGDLGGGTPAGGPAKLFRSTAAAAGLALLVLIFGGLTAKVPGANIVCPSFPLCGSGEAAPIVERLKLIQMTHRVLGILLVLHLFGLVMSTRKMDGAPGAVRGVRIAFGLALLQLLIAGAMIGMRLPPALRSLHQMDGVLIWLSIVVTAALAHRASPAMAPLPPSIAVIIARGGGA
jgi:heme A synthase